MNYEQLRRQVVPTAWGDMMVIADDTQVHCVVPVGLPDVTLARVEPGTNSVIELVRDELEHYCAGQLHEFTVRVALDGTTFQKNVWSALQTVPYGTTCSYGDLASVIHRPTAYRAVGTAVGTNRCAIIVPCHRIVAVNGLGGYRWGLELKKLLLAHEARDLTNGAPQKRGA